jgi:hypothetical protein
LIDSKVDSLAYLPYLQDRRGIRNYLKINQFSNEFFIKSNWSFATGKASLLYDHYSILDGVKAKSVNDITLKFNGLFALTKKLNVNTRVAFGVGTNAGNFDILGSTNFALKKYASVGAYFNLFRSNVAYNENNLYLNGLPIYEKSFRSPFGTSIGGKLTLPLLNMSVDVNQSLINDYIYRSKNGVPLQDTGLSVISQIGLSHYLKVYKFHLENHAFVQSISKNFIPLPKQYIKTNLYYENLVFNKNLLLRLGAEGRYMPKWSIPEYDPVQGAFYLGNDSYKRDYKTVDIYMLGQITKFRIMFKMENVQDYFIKDINYLTVHHPQFDRKIRLGIRWLLLD